MAKTPTPKTAPKSESIFVGLLGHNFCDDEPRRIKNQFKIIRADDRYCVALLYNFTDGSPRDCKVWDIAELKNCTLYQTEDDWTDAYAQNSRWFALQDRGEEIEHEHRAEQAAREQATARVTGAASQPR